MSENRDGETQQEFVFEKLQRLMLRGIRWRGTHQRFLVYGMMTDDNQSFFRSYEKFNAIAFMDYLEAARKKFGKIFVIVDRTPQHKSNDVKKYLRENKDVKLVYLPRGSPHLSMII